MQPAFANYREPHAWLIRGLVEYGWPDTTHLGGRVPPGVFGGLDLSRFAGTGGRAGVTLGVPAIADGSWLQEDGVYEFVARLTRSAEGQLVFAVRCPEANYLEEFPFDEDNPLFSAGYIHQALQQYVPEFVRWRQQGGEVTWAQRAGMPELAGEPCSSMLTQFINERVTLRKPIDVGPAEGWWMDGETGASWGAGPLATVGRAAENTRGEAGLLELARRAAAEAAVARPGAGLIFLSSAGIFSGVLWLLNAPLTLGLIATDQLTRAPSRYLFSLIFSVVLGLSLILGGALAFAGARSYRRLRGKVLPMISILYAIASPMCCFVGMPIGIWALYVWSSADVRQIRNGDPQQAQI